MVFADRLRKSSYLTWAQNPAGLLGLKTIQCSVCCYIVSLDANLERIGPSDVGRHQRLWVS